MSTLSLTPEVVASYKEIIMNPEKYEMPFIALDKCFEKSDTCTPKHILAKQYLDYMGRDLPKVILYIIMDEVFGHCNGKAEDGSFGYFLQFTQSNKTL